LPRSFYDSLNTQTRIRERSEKNGKQHCFDYARGGVDVVVCVVVVLFFDENDDGRKKQHTQHRE